MSKTISRETHPHYRIALSNLDKIVKSLIRKGELESSKTIEVSGFKITFTKIK